MYKGIRLNSKERKELAISEIALIVLAVVGLLVAGWLAWFRPSGTQHEITTYKACAEAGNPIQQSYPSVCVTKDGKRFVNPDDKQQIPAAPDPNASENQQNSSMPPTDGQYLTMNEWGVRVPLTAAYNDMKYTFVRDDTSERVTFTFQRLEDSGICKNDVGVAMTRSKTKNEPPYNLGNPKPVAQVGEYYYYLASAGSPCYDPQNTDHMKLVNTINKGNLTEAVTSTLRKLQPAS